MLNIFIRFAHGKYETHQNRRKYLYSFGISIVLSLIATTLSAIHSFMQIVHIIRCQGEATFAINADGVGDARD